MDSPRTALRIGARADTDLVITDVRITPQHDRALLAFVTITLNDVLVIHGLKVIDGAKGRFVAMPSRPRRDGKHQDIAHPITKEWRGYMEDRILSEFEAAMGEPGADGDGDGR
jgi:stage V sporulation protein G